MCMAKFTLILISAYISQSIVFILFLTLIIIAQMVCLFIKLGKKYIFGTKYEKFKLKKAQKFI